MFKYFFRKGASLLPKKKLKEEIDRFLDSKLKEMGKEKFKKKFLEFQKRYGEVKPHERVYGTYVDYYLNCYLFEQEPRAEAPFPYIHSLFLVKRCDKDCLVIKNLFTRETLTVGSETHLFHGLSKGYVIQGFVFEVEGKHILSNGFIIYEPEKVPLVKYFYRKTRSGIPAYSLLRNLANIKLHSERNSNNNLVFKSRMKSFFE